MTQKHALKAQMPEQVEAGRRQRRRRLAPLTRLQATQLDMGGLDEVIGVMIRRAQVAVFEDYRQLTRDLDISTAQFAVMRLAHTNPGINQTVMANTLGAEASRMVFIIDDLERRGLVTRLASTVDRRSRAIFLTAQGRKLHKAVSKRVERQNRRMIERLRGDDPGTLLRMLRNLAAPV